MMTGSCLCNANKYQIEEKNIIRKITCHCARCRKISGGWSTTNLVVQKEGFKLTSTSTWQTLVPGLSHATSTFNPSLPDKRHGHICFCRHCGSVMYREAEVDGFRDLYFVPVGSLDDIDYVREMKEEEWY
ncbi:hypothetical protein POX_a01551 [Penicillium oxalicum]|uniref:CENP-V/GFA domain-containing protein n=1 Tax=Penicillium oxalicum (strain 114-2 / CGMCC 5302) TaxID=933388 RepID=S7ZXG5_PENO1|nr:hypothetical protein POX_a01551 [Penicillium oxalicum]EPS33456.1 hypothetical protein PDE_08418 [Penicillium oxalicum 114-2]KAI2794950.1 hypothetical protein POX_a01551 [Penicillium oxalicum]